MASTIESLRDELYEYFDSTITPLIKSNSHSDEFVRSIVTKFNAKFGVKYKYHARKYGDTVRVSANYVPLGMVFFMAATTEGKQNAKFADPCYWGDKK